MLSLIGNHSCPQFTSTHLSHRLHVPPGAIEESHSQSECCESGGCGFVGSTTASYSLDLGGQGPKLMIEQEVKMTLV